MNISLFRADVIFHFRELMAAHPQAADTHARAVAWEIPRPEKQSAGSRDDSSQHFCSVPFIKPPIHHRFTASSTY